MLSANYQNKRPKHLAYWFYEQMEKYSAYFNSPKDKIDPDSLLVKTIPGLEVELFIKTLFNKFDGNLRIAMDFLNAHYADFMDSSTLSDPSCTEWLQTGDLKHLFLVYLRGLFYEESISQVVSETQESTFNKIQEIPKVDDSSIHKLHKDCYDNAHHFKAIKKAFENHKELSQSFLTLYMEINNSKCYFCGGNTHNGAECPLEEICFLCMTIGECKCDCADEKNNQSSIKEFYEMKITDSELSSISQKPSYYANLMEDSIRDGVRRLSERNRKASSRKDNEYSKTDHKSSRPLVGASLRDRK